VAQQILMLIKKIGEQMSDLIEVRISRLERLMYLMIGLQVPDLLPLIGIL
jgi:hypothetical protein